MDDSTIISILTAMVSALGLKEFWVIWKRKVELKNKRIQKDTTTKEKLMVQVIEELKEKIDSLEQKVDALINENIELKEELARMEERLHIYATQSVINDKKNKKK